MIPSKPKFKDMSDAERSAAAEKFLSGDEPKKVSNIKPKQVEHTRMYNLPIPVEVNAQAKYYASLEGISLAEYYLQAINEANERRKNRGK